MNTIFITNKVDISLHAESSGVNVIMVDLEILGKKERQKNVNTFITDHRLMDLKKIRKSLKKAKLLVRINPINKNSQQEIEEVLNYEPDLIMLPMFTSVKEVDLFLKLVNGRAKTVLLFETAASLCRVNQIIKLKGIDLAYIGLNDLSLEFKLSFLFELLSGGIIEYLAKIFKSKKIKFGFGGLSRLDEGLLNSRLVLSEHVRLGSEYVILSRSFHDESKSLNDLKNKLDLKSEIKKVKSTFNFFKNSDKTILLDNKIKLNSEIDNIIK